MTQGFSSAQINAEWCCLPILCATLICNKEAIGLLASQPEPYMFLIQMELLVTLKLRADAEAGSGLR